MARIDYSRTAAAIAVLFCLIASVVYAQQAATSTTAAPGTELVSRTCLGCMCEAASGCNTTIGCISEVCGPFRITWAYWADSGKPYLNNEATGNEDYARCVSDPFCSSRSVQGYMAKYAKDCNGDGKVDCDDYVRIHRLGSYGCEGKLDAKYENVYKLCMQTFG
ncbi:lysozyme-like [Prorops nasuta]|uniref:lysozyme-like n=1 Tax=Prorops nasuta TaxID=863751 RepID=UPI0034CD4DF3